MSDKSIGQRIKEDLGFHDPLKLTIADAIEDLKKELALAAKNPKPTLKVKDATVELDVAWTAEADGGFKVWVVDATLKGTRVGTHKVTVHLEPIDEMVALAPEVAGTS